MRKVTLTFVAFFVFALFTEGQEVLVAGWTFPGSSASADTGLVENIGREIATLGGTSDIQFKNGFETKAAQATGWNNGTNEKAWLVTLTTQGLSGLTLSSLQQSGGQEPGPKNFQLQYSIDGGTEWNDLENGAVLVENDWETSFVDHLPLPEICDDLEELQLRWLMISEEASGTGGNVLETGKSKIDNILVHGEMINNVSSIQYPEVRISGNGQAGGLRIWSNETIESVIAVTLDGRSWKFDNLNGKLVDVQLPETLSKQVIICRIQWKKSEGIHAEKVFLH